jgi:hypothetical protein
MKLNYNRKNEEEENEAKAYLAKFLCDLKKNLS